MRVPSPSSFYLCILLALEVAAAVAVDVLAITGDPYSIRPGGTLLNNPVIPYLSRFFRETLRHFPKTKRMKDKKIPHEDRRPSDFV